MPDERMSDDEHPALFAKLNQTIGSSKVVFIRVRMNKRPLQNVFRRDAVEMSVDDLHTAFIFLEDLTPVQSRTNHEVVLKNILQRSVLRGNRKTHRQNTKTQNQLCAFCAFCAFLWPISQPLRA